ncbi:MAG: hypothetical protein Q9167_003654 [Letrouitia subvulpina]
MPLGKQIGKNTKHMDNLWLERRALKTLKAYDTLDGDFYLCGFYPKYSLSDAALIWLALLQIERLVKSIEGQFISSGKTKVDSKEVMIKEVQAWLKSHHDHLGSQQIRSNIFKTFRVSINEDSSQSVAGNNALVSPTAPSDETRTILSGAPDSFPEQIGQGVDLEGNGRPRPARAHEKQVIILQRSIDEYLLDIRSGDFAVIEAAILGIFQTPQNHIEPSWRETQEIQKDKDVTALEDIRHISLTLYASRFKYNIVRPFDSGAKDASLGKLRAAIYESGFFAQANFDMKDDSQGLISGLLTATYEIISLLAGSLLLVCCEVFPSDDQCVEHQKSPKAIYFPKARPTLTTRITLMMPDPVRQSSQINQKDINDTGFLPDWMYYYPDFIHKERLDITTQQQSKELELIKSLESYFFEFFRRHESSESFFRERVSFLGNVWDTELHLGFYCLTEKEANESCLRSKADNQLPDQETPNTSATLHDHRILLVAVSFRFVGDFRDRFWTCHLLSSGKQHNSEKNYLDSKGQRKVIELVHIERALSRMKQSIDEIFVAFKKELEASGLQMDQEDVIEFPYDKTRIPVTARTVLGNVLQQLDSSISVIEQWEKREDTRGLRSRWSQKDQNRYGDRLSTLTLKVKSLIQQLYMQKSRLQEQLRMVESLISFFLSYKQLREAQTSTQSAADVRLFTYVTIIFLPLSFSSSLFSMAGAPKESTIYVMVPTTVIALTVTVLLLANLKLLDRHWNFWVNKLNTFTRRKMQAEEQLSIWKKLAQELEETSQRRLVKQVSGKSFPAESSWYYFSFWLMYAFNIPRSYVRDILQA